MKKLIIGLCLAFLISVTMNAEETASFYYPDGISTQVLEYEVVLVLDCDITYYVRLNAIEGTWEMGIDNSWYDGGIYLNKSTTNIAKIELYTFDGALQMTLYDNFIMLNDGSTIVVTGHYEGDYK